MDTSTTSINENGYAEESVNSKGKKKADLNKSVEDIIEEKIKKNEKLFPTPPA